MHKKLAVLIVEDEKELREIYKEFLEDMNIFSEIQFANNGKEGITKLENKKFQLVITDFNMPGGDGLDIIKKMKKISQQEDLRVILVSGYISKEVLEKAAYFGLKHALTKPVDPDKFEAMIRKVLNLPL